MLGMRLVSVSNQVGRKKECKKVTVLISFHKAVHRASCIVHLMQHMHPVAFLTVVAAFADAVCEQVALQHVPTPHPIVEVNSCPRSVEMDVLSNVVERL